MYIYLLYVERVKFDNYDRWQRVLVINAEFLCKTKYGIVFKGLLYFLYSQSEKECAVDVLEVCQLC